jgi:hypothetical protein
MNRDDIIRMARDAGFRFANEEDPLLANHAEWQRQLFERFAALVAAAERERVMSEPINKEHWQRFEDEIRAAEREVCARVCDVWSEHEAAIDKMKEQQ